MKENIEEDMKRLEKISECFNYSMWEEDTNALKHILSDYRRVLKENEELKHKYDKALSDVIAGVNLDNTYIPKQNIKDKIEELNEYYKKEIYPERFNWADVDITEHYDDMIELLEDLLEEKGE